MTLVLVAALTLSWRPVYVVDARTDALDVWAKDEASATTVARLWTTGNGTPSLEFPWKGATPPDKGPAVYDPRSRPFVRLSDRRTVARVWFVVATPPPSRSVAFRTPTLEA